MSGDSEGNDVEAEGASHLNNCTKSKKKKDDNVVRSIEVVESSKKTANASTTTTALVTPESGAAVYYPSSVSKTSSRNSAIAASEPSTRRSSVSAASISAIRNNDKISVDFDEAPADPVELAIWVAQQIQRFCTDEIALALTTAEAHEARQRSLSHKPGIKAREKADKGLDPEQVEQRNRSRDVASSRKRNWRERKKELNKDNDLRCRINKRARSVYGEDWSKEKESYQKDEFQKRKDKRTRNEMKKPESSFSGFNVPSDLTAKLFPLVSDEVKSEVNAAGILLINTLRLVTNEDAPPSNQDAAFALKSAFDDPEIETQPFIEALRILGADISVMSTLRASFKAAGVHASTDASYTSSMASRANTEVPSVSGEGRELSGGFDDSASPTAPHPRLRGGMIMETNGLSEPDKTVQALNAATDILNKMIEGNSLAYHSPFAKPLTGYVTPQENSYESPYKTPYPNPDPVKSTDVTASALTKSTELQETSKSAPPDEAGNHQPDNAAQPKDVSVSTGELSLEETEENEIVDEFLRVAGGGSLTDDEEDEDDRNHEVINSSSTAQPDNDVEAVLQHVYKMLEARDANGKELAVALRSAVAEVQTMKNVLISREQSQATSRFYTVLANCAQIFSRPGRSVFPQLNRAFLPHHTGAGFPQPADPTVSHPPGAGFPPNPGPAYPKQPGIFIPHHPGGVIYYHSGGKLPLQPVNVTNGPRLPPIVSPAALPSPQPRPSLPSSMPPPPLPGRIGTARGKTVEEAKKVRDYGFPPLPGSRPGMNALAPKRKLGE